jgi:hypothetical protein
MRRFRLVLGLFMAGLVVSGITAFPLEHELNALASVAGLEQASPSHAHSRMDSWILEVRDGLRDTYAKHPWVAYGTDWLAFAHIVIALFFVGAFVDPVRNVWILQAGLIACVLVMPLALVCGAVRQIPLAWRLIDCSFGILGAVPLCYCLRLAKALENRAA